MSWYTRADLQAEGSRLVKILSIKLVRVTLLGFVIQGRSPNDSMLFKILMQVGVLYEAVYLC